LLFNRILWKLLDTYQLPALDAEVIPLRIRGMQY